MCFCLRLLPRTRQGWTLLGDCCPQAGCATPLLRARTPGAKLYCPQHDGFMEAADGARVARRRNAAPRLTAAPAAEEAAAEQPSGDATRGTAEHEDPRLGPYAKAAAQPQAPSTAAHPSAPAPEKKAADAVIADYLLNGWTMLAEACPIAGCYSPLMWQKAERKRFCPVHQLYVLTGAFLVVCCALALVCTHARRPAADAEAARAAGKPQSEVAATETQAESAPPAQPSAAPAAAPARDDAVAQTVAAAVPVLLERIASATILLDENPLRVSHGREVVAFINECATAIKALREL